MRTLLALGLVLAAAAASAQDRLNDSPRHQEWVKVAAGGVRQVSAFLVYPEVAGKATAVVVIHENRGLTDWVRTVADRLAENGYIAIAPDLLSGAGPGGGGTGAFASPDEARQAISSLDADRVAADLSAVADYVGKLPAASGKVAVAGFCWGGAQSFRLATARHSLAAAFVFYGTAPDSAALRSVQCPVYGFYGGSDERVNATIEPAAAVLAAAGRRYEPVIYPGAGHGFMRAGEAPDASEANRAALTQGWARWLALLAAL